MTPWHGLLQTFLVAYLHVLNRTILQGSNLVLRFFLREGKTVSAVEK